MPPKKAGAKGSKGKGKGGDAKANPKMSKKEKKLWAKFGMHTAEGPDGKEASLPAFRRDELEWAVDRLRAQVTEQRSERIRYQLERDFLNELADQYRKKLDCLLLEQDALIAKNNKAAQDAEENKIIKGQEGKHFRAETQIMATHQECRNEIRRKKIKELLDRSWQQICMDLDELEALLAKNAAEYKRRIAETQKKLQDLHLYMADHERQLEEYIKNLEKEKQNSMTLFFVIRRMEFQLSEERWDEFIWKLSSNFENSLKAMKNFYNDASFSNFTMMYTLQDMVSSSVERMEQYRQRIKELQHMMQEAHSQMPYLRVTYTSARVRHNRIVRTKQGISTVVKELVLIQNKTNSMRVEYRQNYYRLENMNAERTNFRTNGAELVQNILDAYNDRFRIQEDLGKMQLAVNQKDRQMRRLATNFKDKEHFRTIVQPFKTNMLERQELVQEYHLNSLRVRKQADNLRNSLDARLRHLGLTRKHATVPLKMSIGSPFARDTGNAPRIASRINWGPANLVAGSAFPYKGPPKSSCVGRLCSREKPSCGGRGGEEVTQVPCQRMVSKTYKVATLRRMQKVGRSEDRFYC